MFVRQCGICQLTITPILTMYRMISLACQASSRTWIIYNNPSHIQQDLRQTCHALVQATASPVNPASRIC